MKHYYEVSTPRHDNSGFNEIFAFNTLEEAIIFAEQKAVEYVYEIGGGWGEFQPCVFCGEWFDITELNDEYTCTRCDYNLNYR